MFKKRWLFLFVGGLLLPFALLVIMVGGLASISNSANSSQDGVTYVEHWSTGDPYTHNLLTHRYGITAQQLDGFLETTGIAYDKSRLNGTKLLQCSYNGK